MDFLKKLFGGGGGARVSGDPDGLYYYVRPNGCEEVVRVRVNRYNDLSLTDDGKTLWAHKLARGVKCRQSVELDLYYDANRKLTNSEVSGGTLVTEADYEEWVAKQDAPQT
jgi:hypothetical protein